jgi:hemerythrin-like domain-containing protein
MNLVEKGDPSPGFEQPFEMLRACHERIERMLALLGRLRQHVAQRGADEQARQAARDVMRYFDVAAPQHHLDEERHVLPRLEASGDPSQVDMARRLHDDHRTMEARWALARPVLHALAEGAMDRLDEDSEGKLQSFASTYAEHIAAEESLAFPAVSRAIDPAALGAMSEDMMRRRGVR